MKRHRVVIALLVTLAVLGAVLYWSPRGQTRTGFATPADCLDAYHEASTEGDVEKYRICLGEPLRSRSSETAESLRQMMRDVTGWVKTNEVIEDSTAYVDVDEVRTSVRRIRFRLERGSAGWLIVAIGPPEEQPTPIRPGTHVRDVPN